MAEVKTVLVTGSTDGLGRCIAERLAAPEVHLLVHGRDAARGDETVARLTSAGGTARFVQADFSSLSEVRAFAASVSNEYDRLDALINNAGIAQVDGPRQLSRDGHELHLAVNYLAPALLTRLLLPLLTAARGSRVVNVTSAAQQALDFEDLMLEQGYSGYRAYGQSKLAQVMFTFDLAREVAGEGVTVNCVHPADFMDTGPVRAAGIRPTNSVDRGATAVIRLTTDQVPAGSAGSAGSGGRYYNGVHEARANPQAYDEEARRRLREVTIDLVRER